MKKICKNCKHFEPIEDNSIYEKEWDGHCGINSDLIYSDNICKEFENEESESERVCGACCHFMSEDTDGWGICPFQDVCDAMHCSDLCTTDRFVSNEVKRHHLAMLRKCQRCLNGNIGTKQDMDVKEIGEAIDFVVEYCKIH